MYKNLLALMTSRERHISAWHGQQYVTCQHSKQNVQYPLATTVRIGSHIQMYRKT